MHGHPLLQLVTTIIINRTPNVCLEFSFYPNMKLFLTGDTRNRKIFVPNIRMSTSLTRRLYVIAYYIGLQPIKTRAELESSTV